ncbi:MAG: hypothetical protein H6715_03095 [Myxococcales bacterium]|nr:hypothetical protein [Myxococcales bacterium]
MPPVSSLIELFPEDWSRLLETWGEPRYRARQIFRWIHQRGVMDAEEMTDLPLPLRRRLATEGLSSPVTLATTFASPDGTQKLLFALEDQANIESVLIPPFANDEATPDGWVTPSVSSGVLGCVFCVSGVAGFVATPSASETG